MLLSRLYYLLSTAAPTATLIHCIILGFPDAIAGHAQDKTTFHRLLRRVVLRRIESLFVNIAVANIGLGRSQVNRLDRATTVSSTFGELQELVAL